MALSWFLLGIVIIFGIAKYNESNKLFWVLLVSFIGSFTMASVVISTTSENKDQTTKVYCPTQGSSNVSSNISLADINLNDTVGIPKPVSYGITPICSLVMYSKVRLYENGQVVKLLKPPIQC